jgi:DNA-binding NarL/FixJ family response regulator
MIRVLLADDESLVRAGFRSILAGEPDLEVVAEAGTGTEALRLARVTVPDVALVDIRMPGDDSVPDGIAATRLIRADQRLRSVKVVILTTFDVDEYVYAALRAGASGFLVKNSEAAELIHAVRVVARGDALIAPAVTRRLIADLATRQARPDPDQRLGTLTAREREVLTLVARGLSNNEIAEHLVLSPATSKSQVSRLMTKLDVRDRAQLIVLAYETGLVTPDWLG